MKLSERWKDVIIFILVVGIVMAIISLAKYDDLASDQNRQIEEIGQQRDQLQQELNNCKEKVYWGEPSDSPDSNGDEYIPPGLPDTTSI